MIKIEKCNNTDFDEIIKLLSNYKLITQDLDLDKQYFLKLVIADKIIAVGALELLSPYGLIRSLAVKPDYLEKGYASQIFKELEQIALQNKTEELYLLTETAESFFNKHHFLSIHREKAPQGIKQTSQFASLCPDDAILMKKRLL